jgi:hypothetical protein
MLGHSLNLNLNHTTRNILLVAPLKANTTKELPLENYQFPPHVVHLSCLLVLTKKKESWKHNDNTMNRSLRNITRLHLDNENPMILSGSCGDFPVKRLHPSPSQNKYNPPVRQEEKFTDTANPNFFVKEIAIQSMFAEVDQTNEIAGTTSAESREVSQEQGLPRDLDVNVELVDALNDHASENNDDSSLGSFDSGIFEPSLEKAKDNEPIDLSNEVSQARVAKPKRSSLSGATPECHEAALPSAKKQRVDESSIVSRLSKDDSYCEGRFKNFQAEQWHDRYVELCEVRRKFGHCQVPHFYEESPTLFRWAKRQRYQFKLWKENKPSTMTSERIVALDKINFVWDTLTAQWEERLNELKEYNRIHRNCNVPSAYSLNPKLAIWIKCQRRQYKILWAGQPSNITHERIDQLNSIDFNWEIRSPTVQYLTSL